MWCNRVKEATYPLIYSSPIENTLSQYCISFDRLINSTTFLNCLLKCSLRNVHKVKSGSAREFWLNT